MSTTTGLVALVAGVVLVVGAADMFVDGLLGVGRRFGVAPFVLTVALSGFETENLAAGIATNAKGLPEAAAGTFLGGVTFLALGVAGLGWLIAPMEVRLPRRFAAWTALAPVPLLVFALDGRLSRIEGVALVAWFVIALAAARSVISTTGLSETYCSLIRLGKRAPHPRHWEALRAAGSQAHSAQR